MYDKDEVVIRQSTEGSDSGLISTLTKEGVDRNVAKARMLEEMLSEGFEPVLTEEERGGVRKIGEPPMPWDWNPYWSPTPIDPADPNLQPKVILE